MPKKQDWLEIIEKASELKKGTKLPKNFDVDSLVMLMYRAPQKQPGMSWNTGAGANGVVEPDKPVALDTRTSPPSVYHEGEPVQEFPGGRNITPAGVVPAQTEQQQMGLGRMQQERRYPGFQTGGTVYDDPYGTTATRPTNTLSLSPQGDTFQSGVNQAFDTTKQRAAGNDPLMQNISNRALQDYDTRAAVGDTVARQYTASDPYATLGAKRAVVAKQGATYRAGLSGLVGDLSEKAMTRAEQANTQLYNMGREQVQDELSAQKWEKTFGEGQYQTDLGQGNWQKGFDFEKQKYGDQEFSRMAEDAQSTDFATWQKKYPAATQADYNTAREYRTRQLQAMDTANLTASENLTQLKKSDKWKDAQAFLDAGDFKNYAAIVKSITGKDINFTDFVEDRDYLMNTRNQNLEAGDIANDAARLGLDITTMNAVIQAANNGYAADMINNQLGTNLFQYEIDAIAEKYRQGITSGNIELDRLKNSLGDAEYSSIQDMINGGSSLEAVNARLATQGKMGLTLPEFESMLSATPLGEATWGRKMGYANMLLQSQDPDNMVQASRIFGEMFPGTTFDVGQLISDIGAERFAKGMTDMATLANTFKSWGEAASSVQGLNLINSMGIDDTTAAQMFQGLKLNAIDQEWDAIEGSKFYQGLLANDPAGAENIRNTFEKGLTGELEFDIKPVYNITDSNGQFVKSFDNIVDANKFLGDNADKAYMVKEASNYIYKNMATGDTVVVNNGTGEATPLKDTPITTGEAWNAFSESQASLPESKQIGYDDFIASWNKAGKPNTYTYDDYMKTAKAATETFTNTIVDKYKDGWPPVKMRSETESTPYPTQQISKDQIMAARKAFMAEPEKTIKIEPANSVQEFGKITNEMNGLAENGAAKDEWNNYITNKLIYLDGYDAPFILADPITDRMAASSSGGIVKSLMLMSLKDGELIRLNQDGTTAEQPWTPVKQ